MQIVKEFPYLVISWDEECRSLVIQWRGGFKGRNLKEGLTAALAEFQKRRPQAQWIGDTTDIGTIGIAEQTWIDQEWQPQLIATGLKYMAIIHPQNAIAKMTMTQIIAQIPSTQITVYNCATLEEARQWMKQQKF
jgi:hypothetical protein